MTWKSNKNFRLAINNCRRRFNISRKYQNPFICVRIEVNKRGWRSNSSTNCENSLVHARKLPLTWFNNALIHVAVSYVEDRSSIIQVNIYHFAPELPDTIKISALDFISPIYSVISLHISHKYTKIGTTPCGPVHGLRRSWRITTPVFQESIVTSYILRNSSKIWGKKAFKTSIFLFPVTCNAITCMYLVFIDII